MRSKKSRVATALVALGLVVAACGSDDDSSSDDSSSDDSSSDGEASDLEGTLRVLIHQNPAGVEFFESFNDEFEAANPGVDIQLSFGGSSALRVQVEEGAPAAVVAFADPAPMTALADAGLVTDAVIFATNSIVLATPIDDPGSVDDLSDLADPELLVGICATQVPCGGYARELFDRAGLDASIDTEEPDVRALVSKLVAGELDAGLVYATDVRAMPDRLREVALPSDVGVRADYPIAAVADAADRLAAEQFVDFVTSTAGQNVMADAGFGGL